MESKSFLHFEIGFYRLKRRLLQEFLKSYNLKIFDSLLVMIVAARPGCSQGDIINHLMSDEASVARGLRNLEKTGFILRQEDPDNHRKKLVYPTPKAQTFFKELNKFLDSCGQIIFKYLTPSELNMLNDLIQRVEKDFKQVNYRHLIAELTKNSEK